MTIQITVRLPDDQVHFLDQQVSAGHAPSRAAAIARALRREQRRSRAESELATLTTAVPDRDMDALHDWVGSQQWPDLDDPYREDEG